MKKISKDLFTNPEFSTNICRTNRYYKLTHDKILAFIHEDGGNPIYPLP